jgi:hypothetical protein
VRFGMAETPSTPMEVPWLAYDQMSETGGEDRNWTQEEQMRSMVEEVSLRPVDCGCSPSGRM